MMFARYFWSFEFLVIYLSLGVCFAFSFDSYLWHDEFWIPDLILCSITEDMFFTLR